MKKKRDLMVKVVASIILLGMLGSVFAALLI